MIDKPAVDHLHMVELRLTGSSPCDVQADGIQTEMRFLYGVGTGGLTTFEQQMHGKTPGDTFSMRVDAQNLATDFAHLRQTLVKAVGRTLPLDLEIEIVSVRRATDRGECPRQSRRDAAPKGDPIRKIDTHPRSCESRIRSATKSRAHKGTRPEVRFPRAFPWIKKTDGHSGPPLQISACCDKMVLP